MARYTTIKQIKSDEGQRMYVTVKYPNISPSITDIYVFVSAGDRYDLLASSYYGDSSLWWIISTANPNQPKASLYPTPGSQIRIPTNITEITSQYNTLNPQ